MPNAEVADLSKFKKQAVQLGQEYRITLGKDFNHNLRQLAAFHNVKPNAYAHHLLERAIQLAAQEVSIAFAVVNFMCRGLVQ